MGCCLSCHPAVNNSDSAGGKTCVHEEGAWSLLLCLFCRGRGCSICLQKIPLARRRGCILRLLQAAKQRLATVGEAKAAPGLVTPRKQERFQVALVAHSHLSGPLLTILPHIKICILHSSLLAPEKQHKIQLQASAQSCNVSLQTCKSKAINQPTRNPFSYLSAQEVTPLISSQQHKIKPSDTSAGTSGLSPSIQGLRDPLLPLPHPALRPAAPHLATT